MLSLRYIFTAFALVFCFFFSLVIDAQTVHQGKVLYSKGNYIKSLSIFKRIVKSRPNNGVAYYYIARIYNDQKKIKKSISYFERAIIAKIDKNLRVQILWKVILFHKHKQNWNKLYKYTVVLLKYKRNNKKLLKIKELAERKRSSHFVPEYSEQMHKALLATKYGKIDKAISLYAEVLSADSSYHVARWNTALLLMKLTKFSQANDYLQILIRDDRFNKQRWEYHYKSAICHYKLGEMNKAFHEIQNSKQSNTNKTKTFRYHASYLEGRIFLKKSEFKKAYRTFKFARNNIAKPPVKLLEYYSLASLESDHLHDARIVSRKTLKIRRYSKIARLVQARLTILAGNKAKAYGQIKRLLSQFTEKELLIMPSSYTPAFFFLGINATKQKNYTTALAAFKSVNINRLTSDAKIARLKNKMYDPLWNFNYYYGIALLRTNEPSRAILLFDKLEKNERSYFLLAKAYANNDNATKAKKLLLQSTKINLGRWDIALADIDFKNLMDRDPLFKKFITTRNQTDLNLNTTD